MRVTVIARYDATAGVWYVFASDLPGLHVEASTLAELVAVIEDVVPDLAAVNLP